MNARDDGLCAEWLEASDAYGWRAVLRNLTPYLVLLALAPRLAAVSAAAAWALAPLIGLLAYRLTVVMHDCTHRTLFRERRWNVRVGLALGAVTGVDFYSFGRQHWRHHRNFGARNDPQGFHYVGLQALTRRQFMYRLARPLLGLNLRYTLPESLLAPANVHRSLASGYLWIAAAVQAGMLALVTGFGRQWWLAPLPFVSSATFGLFFSQLRGVAEHGVTSGDGEGYVRSHAPHWLDRLLLYDLHFNLHAEHHRFPEIPSCHLPRVQRALSQAPAAGSMFATLRAILRTLDRKPA